MGNLLAHLRAHMDAEDTKLQQLQAAVEADSARDPGENFGAPPTTKTLEGGGAGGRLRGAQRYEISKKIGEGTGGIVFLASIVEPSQAAAEYGLRAGASTHSATIFCSVGCVRCRC